MLESYEEWEAYGGEVSHIDVITDPVEAEKARKMDGLTAVSLLILCNPFQRYPG